MSAVYYKQCTYQQVNGGLMETAWIPEKFAEVGRVIYFGKKTATPELWKVISASDLRMPEAYIAAHERDYKHQREASDI